MQTLRVVEVSDLRVASDKRNYFVATFSSGFGQKVAKRTFWEQFKKDATGANTEEKYWERGSHTEALELLKTGERIEGSKITKKVESYTIGEGENARNVDMYTTIVFPGEDIQSVFTQSGHNIVDETTGEVLKPKAVLASNKLVEEQVEETK